MSGFEPTRVARTMQLTLALVLAANLSACVTTEQVKAIVDDSNQEILTLTRTSSSSLNQLVQQADAELIDEIGGIPNLNADGDPSASWEAAIERIERFIASHPSATVVNNSLRMRQAVILMLAEQLNLADAVFEEVNRNEGLNQRDRAILDAKDALLFWYGLSNGLDAGDMAAIPGHLATLATVADELPMALDVRRYMEQVRVRMALRLARASISLPDFLTAVEAPLARYGKTFDDTRDVVRAWHKDELSGQAAVNQLASLRWYNYVPCAFSRADALLETRCERASLVGEAPERCDDSLTPSWLEDVSIDKCTN